MYATMLRETKLLPSAVTFPKSLACITGKFKPPWAFMKGLKFPPVHGLGRIWGLVPSDNKSNSKKKRRKKTKFSPVRLQFKLFGVIVPIPLDKI
jgi:hypothetical protein